MEQIFAELVFAILAVTRKDKFREAYAILNNCKIFCPEKFDGLWIKKKQTSLKVH